MELGKEVKKMSDIITMVVFFAAFMTCFYMERRCQRKLEEKSYRYQEIGNLLSLVWHCDSECKDVLERCGDSRHPSRSYAAQIEEIVKKYKESPYKIYKEHYRREAPDFGYDTWQQYESQLSSIKSTYLAALRYITSEKRKNYPEI